MPVKPEPPLQAEDQDISFGLLACGVSGGWRINVDEAMSGEDQWLLQIDAPAIEFEFRIPSLEILSKILVFLEIPLHETREGGNGRTLEESLTISRDTATLVRLIRDDEYNDRFFLVIGPSLSPMVRFTVAGSDREHLSEALRQVQEDLDE